MAPGDNFQETPFMREGPETRQTEELADKTIKTWAAAEGEAAAVRLALIARHFLPVYPRSVAPEGREAVAAGAVAMAPEEFLSSEDFRTAEMHRAGYSRAVEAEDHLSISHLRFAEAIKQEETALAAWYSSAEWFNLTSPREHPRFPMRMATQEQCLGPASLL